MKRIYNDAGNSAPAWFVKTAVVIAFVPLIAWAFISVLIRDFGRTFRAAQLEVRIEIETIKRGWNSAR